MMKRTAGGRQQPQLRQRPAPGCGVQAKLNAGDAAVYILPILHWVSDYTDTLRRCIHGGFAEFSHYPGLQDYHKTLAAPAQEMFTRWEARTAQKLELTERALRAAIPSGAGEGSAEAYMAALGALHSGVGAGEQPGSGFVAVRRQSTAFLSKAARRIAFLQLTPTVEDGMGTGALGLGNTGIGTQLLSWTGQGSVQRAIDTGETQLAACCLLLAPCSLFLAAFRYSPLDALANS